MSRFDFSKSLRGRTAAAALVLLAGVVLPRVADAGCGEYVLVRGRALHGSRGSMDSGSIGDGAAHADYRAVDADAQHSDSTPLRPTCRGPTCSNDTFPPAAPAPRITVPIDQWACADHGEALDPIASTRLLAESRDVPREGCGLSILRPPR